LVQILSHHRAAFSSLSFTSSSWWKQCPSSSSPSCSGCQGALGFHCDHPLLPHDSSNCHHHDEEYNIIKNDMILPQHCLFCMIWQRFQVVQAVAAEKVPTIKLIIPLVKLVAMIAPWNKLHPKLRNKIVYIHCGTVCQASHMAGIECQSTHAPCCCQHGQHGLG